MIIINNIYIFIISGNYIFSMCVCMCVSVDIITDNNIIGTRIVIISNNIINIVVISSNY